MRLQVFFQRSNAEIQAGLHWSLFKSLKGRAGESTPNWLSLSGRNCPKILLHLAFGNKERRSKKAPNAEELPCYWQVLSASWRELHFIVNVGSTYFYWVRYYGPTDWINAGWKGPLEVMLPSPPLKAGPSPAQDQVSHDSCAFIRRLHVSLNTAHP